MRKSNNRKSLDELSGSWGVELDQRKMLSLSIRGGDGEGDPDTGGTGNNGGDPPPVTGG